MSEQTQTTPVPNTWTAGQSTPPAPAPADATPATPAQPSADEQQIADLKAQLAAALEANTKPAPSAAPATPAPPVAPDFKVGQLVGYSEDYLGFDVARHGIVVAIEKSELADGSEKYFGRVVPLPAALHLPADQLTAQD